MATISISGDLILDQSPGVQDDDVALDVQVDAGIDNLVNAAGAPDISTTFLNYINGLTTGLTDQSMGYAARVEGASQANMVQVTNLGANETINRLFFTDAQGNELFGQATTVQTLGGNTVYLYTAAGTNGKIVLATDSAPVGGAIAGNVVAAFYLDTNATNTNAGIQAITFMALKHPLGGPNNPDDRVDFTDFLKVSALVTNSTPIGVDDDPPTIVTSGAVEPNATVDESVLTTDGAGSFAGNFTPDFGTDGEGSTGGVGYTLGVVAGASGLTDTLTGQAVNLSITNGVVSGKTATGGDTVFTVSVNATTGVVTLDQQRAVVHANPNDADESRTLSGDNLVTLKATITDADGDTAEATLNIGQNLVFKDDGPTITVPVAYPSSTTPPTTAAHLGNATGQSVSGNFGYDIGADGNLYPAAGADSDFVDANPGATGVQLSLTGTVSGPPSANIITPTVTLASETSTSATFNFSFNFDGDPSTAGVQTASAGGTLVFNKVADTFTVNLTDAVDGFSNSILRTSQALERNPNTNSGHPTVVVQQLAVDNAATTTVDEDFYVQFTANLRTNPKPLSFTNDGEGTSNDTAYNGAGDPHDMVSNDNETWVSATENTNGVAGDTIQQDEVLTLRFFNENILADASDKDPNTQGVQPLERIDPTKAATADGVVLKFDGIGASEDLIMVLDLKDMNGGASITRAITVDNADIFKTGQVPSGYSVFTLDNNDGLVILESNDYNKAGENYEIQGVQIMQSRNGLTGSGINLNGAVGSNGAATFDANGNFVTQAFDSASFGNEQDVLKITDIGFIQTTRGTQSADLDFAFQITDGDGDLTLVQHINVNIASGWIVP